MNPIIIYCEEVTESGDKEDVKFLHIHKISCPKNHPKRSVINLLYREYVIVYGDIGIVGGNKNRKEKMDKYIEELKQHGCEIVVTRKNIQYGHE